MLCRYDALRSLCLNSRVLPRSLSFCPRSGEGSFCRCNLPAPAFHVMAALPAPPAPVPDKAVEEPAGAVEAAPPPVVEPEVFFAFLLFRSASPASHSFLCHAFTYFSVRYFSILPNVVLRFACWLPRVYSGVIFPYASVFAAL